MTGRVASVVLVLTALVLVTGCQASQPTTVRFATFNASLNRDKPGQLAQDLSTPDNQQARNVAEVIQRVRPDVLLINEFDYEDDGKSPELFQKNYLGVSQNGAEPIDYPHRVYLPVNTGVHSGFDLDNDGQVVKEPGSRGYGNDCFGFGQFPGQYGMLLLSKYPLHGRVPVRSFRDFKWKDLPGSMLPNKEDGSPWHSDEELAVMPLSSKSHLDVGLSINGNAVHVLASHPTPPAFDGPEDRNGKRNHDEIRFWREHLTSSPNVYTLTHGFKDDDGGSGGLYGTVPFVLMGDQNADPADGGSIPGAIQQLLDHPRINSTFIPRSDGAAEAAIRDGGHNASHKTPHEHDTADFGDAGNAPGNLRVDYVLPSKNLKVIGGGVFWPTSSDPLYRLVQMKPTVATSDHRLVYLDVQIP